MKSDSGRTTSLWMATADTGRHQPLGEDAQADVCVVGAGIAGMTTAYLLARSGKKVLVLDDGPVGGGETGRTTAHLAYYLDDDLHSLEQLHGEEGARRAVQSHAMAVNRIEEIVRLEGIECSFERVDGWLILAPGESEDILDKELEAARRAGIADAAKLARAPLPFETGRCLRFPNQAQFHPLQYLAGLARAVEASGGRIATGVHVTEVEGRPRRPRAKTDGGHTVTADAVAVCTNSPISDYVVTHLKQAAYRTFVIGARIPSGSVTPGLYWDTADPYVYVRTHRVADHDVLIVGGEDHKTGQEDDAPERFGRLEAWARQRFPMVERVEYRWSGQVLEPADGLAFIGRNPDGAENVYLATGDSGQGMTHGTIAGVLLTDLILGRESPYETLYDPKRVSLRAAKDLLRENINVAARYADWVTPGEVSSADEIEPGTGALLRRGTKKIAIFRDDDGSLHERSATCTHLGCIVQWNSTERSWDCPCHGSRFDGFGKVVNGPAISPLELITDE
ncbi:MAG: FAD-dependent oxidoreductase [Gemmatimonadota bacterium]|nr:FAD-dependent oxidoreductase [Gemmatimonadota bacterium]